MSQCFTAACIQNCADTELEANIEQVTGLVRQAARAGAELVCLPENFSGIQPTDALMLQAAYTEQKHPAIPHFRGLARELAIWLLMGSLPIKIADDKLNNRSYLVNPEGEISATYNKIHLFDVSLKDGESYRESSTVSPGNEAVVAATPWGGLGMSICYDVRFPYLYRYLALAGARFIAVPAAFTRTTGEAHWHVLLRARAIETGSYVLAPCQNGVRRSGRATFGHSLIIDPWGRILADAGEESGFVAATIDPGEVIGARRMIPSLQHGREIVDAAG